MSHDQRVSWLHDLLDMPLRVKEMWSAMADFAQTLNEVADNLRGPLYSSVQALIARNAELETEETGQSDAAANVVSAFGQLSTLFTNNQDLPDVPPLEPAPVDDSGATS